ncbi:MAG: B12-binding domain-containing radical SAM protein [Candidatus Muiribacteriaceae bacterium]
MFYNNIYRNIYSGEEGINIFERGRGIPHNTPDLFRIGNIQTDKFIRPEYRLPYSDTPIWTTTASQGCPYCCDYCHFEKIPYATRDLSDLEMELENIYSKGIRHIHFRDQCFGHQHFNSIIRILRKYDFEFTIYARADSFRKFQLKELKKSGLSTVETGVESSVYSTRKKHGKMISDKKYTDFIQTLHSLDIQTNLIFIIGLEDTSSEAKGIIRFLKKTHPDFISLNTLIRKPGTSLNPDYCAENMDPSLSNDRKRNNIRTDIYIRYYFHPAVLFRQLKSIKKISALIHLIRNGYFLLKNIFFR